MTTRAKTPPTATPRGGPHLAEVPTSRRSLRLLLLFLGLAALFYAPLLLGLRTFPDGDFTHHFLSFSLFQQQELLSGRLPLWNPYTYGGHPFLADVQAAVFYPLSNLFLGLTLPWTDAGVRLYFLQVEAVAQVALAGFFTWLLAAQLTGSRWAGVVAGLCFAFSGYLTGYPPVQLAVLRTAIWLPLLLWLLLRAVNEPQRWRWWIGAGVTAAVAFVAGHSQTFLYIVYCAAAWLLLLIVLRRRSLGGREWAALLLGLLGSGLLAGGLSSVQLLPSLEFAGLSVRANVDYAYVAGGFPLQDGWQLLLPGVLTHYSPLYIGVIGLGLACLGALVALRGLPAAQGAAHPAAQASTPAVRAGAAFFLVLTVAALLLSLGENGFLYPLFHRFAPGFNLFRGQERAAYLVTLGLSILAAYGGLAVTRLSARSRGWWATAFAAAAIAATYLFGLLWQLSGRTAVSQAHFLLMAALTVTLASVFALLLRAPGWSRRRGLWLAALLFANLLAANVTTNLADFSPARKTLLAPEVQAVQEAAGQAAAAASAGGRLPGRVYNEFRAYEDYAMRIGVEDVWGASPLRLARYAALFEEFPLDRMWQLLGVEHVLTWRKDLFGPSTLLGEFAQASDTTYLHQLPDAAPRAWFVDDVAYVGDEEALQLLADHQFDLAATALLPLDAAASTATSRRYGPRAGTDPAQVVSIAPGHLRISVSTPAGGLLVVSENWMPGWRVDFGQQAAAPALQPLRANLTLLALPVPPGDLTFDLVYQPDSVRLGLWISAATLLLLTLALLGRALRALSLRRGDENRRSGENPTSPAIT